MQRYLNNHTKKYSFYTWIKNNISPIPHGEIDFSEPNKRVKLSNSSNHGLQLEHSGISKEQLKLEIRAHYLIQPEAIYTSSLCHVSTIPMCHIGALREGNVTWWLPKNSLYVHRACRKSIRLPVFSSLRILTHSVNMRNLSQHQSKNKKYHSENILNPQKPNKLGQSLV